MPKETQLVRVEPGWARVYVLNPCLFLESREPCKDPGEVGSAGRFTLSDDSAEAQKGPMAGLKFEAQWWQDKDFSPYLWEPQTMALSTSPFANNRRMPPALTEDDRTR